MRNPCLLLLTLISLLLPASSWAQECHKSFRLRGTGNDGQPKDFVIQLRRPLREPQGFDPIMEEIGDEKFYRGSYQIIGRPTYKQNCAGYVMHKLWGIENTYFPAEQMSRQILQIFGRKITSGYQPGDVVVFGAEKHVAVVVGLGITSSRVIIESKDNQESIVRGELHVSGRANDPIKQKNGAPSIYRLVSQVSVTEVAPGDCDVADLTITIDVNESLNGTLRPLGNANVALRLSSGEIVGSQTSNAEGKATILITNNPPGRVAAARNGLSVKVSVAGYVEKPDTIPPYFLTGNERLWNMTLMRTPDNPLEADPNIMPPPVSPIALADWQKKLEALLARLAALEAKKAEILKKQTSSQTNVGKINQAEIKARAALTELQQLKPAVNRVEQYCKDASKANQQLEALEKTLSEKEKTATALTDELLQLIQSCTSREDVTKIRTGITRLRQLLNDMADPVKQARTQNDELKRLHTESLKELPELMKAIGFRKTLSEQETAAGQAFQSGMDDFGQMMKLESDLNTGRFALSKELFDLRRNYPGKAIPPTVDQQLTAADDRINNLVVSSGQVTADIATKLQTLGTMRSEADTLLRQYQAAVCTIKTREDLLDKMVGSVTFAGLGLQSLINSEAQIKQCEARLDCAAQIKLIEQALDIGDLETSTQIIAQSKGGGCDTSKVEARHQGISDRWGFQFVSARNLWRDIASHCNYRMASDAALVIQKEFPKHPWIVKNFADVERAWKTEQQIRALVDQLVIADRARNYDEAEKLLGQIEKIAPPYPCLVAEYKKLRTEYGRGKSASPETERTCKELLAQIQQAIAAQNLTEAAQKLQQAQQQCANVSPALFTGLGTARQQLEQAIQQAISEVQVKAGKCEYQAAYRMAEQIQILKPTALPAAEVQQLRQQAEAQKNARQFLESGQEAIRQKNIKGAITSLRQALGVAGLPLCMRNNINSLLKELELRQNFMALTEQVEDATRKCDYKEATRVVGDITRLRPREQFMSDWININVPVLAELQRKERQGLDLIKQAEASIVQAETVASTEPVDANRVATLIQQTRDLLIQADKEAPKCLPQRQQMELIRQRCDKLANRKKPEIAASIALLIDTSGSMAENNKINQAKDAARRAARQASKTTEIAILHFDGGCSAGAMREAAPFTTDVNVLLAAIDTLHPGGGTPMYIATAAAVEYAQRQGRGKQKVVVLMSDGGDSCRDQQTQAAASIKQSNIQVSTIGFDVGNNQQAQGDLGNLATMTGGRTFSASAADPREIIRAFNLAMLPSLLKDFDFGNAASNVANYFTQAKTMVQQQNVSGALMMLQQANSLAPNSPNLNFNLSLLYESQDQLIPAMNHANNYLRLAPGAVDRADVENRIAEIQKELQANPRVVMDSSGCRDVLSWAQAEQDVAKRGRDVARRQAVLEVLIAAQRGDCENARKLQTGYKQRFGNAQ